MPVRQRVVRGAWPGTIVQTAEGLRAAGHGTGLCPGRAGRWSAEALRAITTSCGFLVLLQVELQAAARVPVITSSLLQLPGLLARQPRVGVLTISAAALGSEHLSLARRATVACGPAG